MTKECTPCRLQIDDDEKKICPYCGKPLTDAKQGEPQARLTPAMKEVIRTEAKKAVCECLGVGTVAIAVALLVALLTVAYSGYRAARNQLKQQISMRLDAEFNEPNLKATVRESAQAEANVIIREQVAPAVAKFREDVNNFTAQAASETERLESEFTRFVAKMAETTQVHSEILEKLTFLNVYTQTVINAEAGYRKAYDQLRSWANDKSFLLTEQALQVYKKITSIHNPAAYKHKWPISSWFGDGDPSTLNLPELVSYYQKQTPLSFRKVAVIDYIYFRKDLPKVGKMQFFIKVIEKDDSLDAVEFAGRYFRTLAGLKLHPLAVDDYLKWWAENKDSLSSTPKS